MGAAAFQPGLYGKLPVLGDFVTRRLPRQFVAVWDLWLQSSLSASQEQLGEAWLEVYLTSPLWRFGLSPGLCGENAWAGVLMPSVDKVGRYFPLTLAAPVGEPECLEQLFGAAGGDWFERLERLALSCLEDNLGVDALDESLQASPPPRFAPVSRPAELRAGNGAAGKFACHVGMETLAQVPDAFVALSSGLLGRFLPLRSLWATSGSEHVGASLLVCEGLPPIDTFSALLAGDWGRRGWALHSLAVRVLSPGGGPAPAAPAVGLGLPADDALLSAVEAVTRPRLPAWVWRSWGVSVAGKKRSLNEDNMIERSGLGLWAVADGMGGHLAGEVASQAIVDALAELDESGGLAELAGQVGHSLQEVNAKLCRMAEQRAGEGEIIGSTVVVLLACGDRCVFQWAGDSRLYRFRGGTLEQLTRDHSLLEDMDRQGLLSPGQLADPGRCDIITRAVGAAETLQLERAECDAQAGDLFLLCSDGLDKELAREEIEAVFRREAKEDIAQVLVEQAEDRGARDNVTVVVVEAARREDGPAQNP